MNNSVRRNAAPAHVREQAAHAYSAQCPQYSGYKYPLAFGAAFLCLCLLALNTQASTLKTSSKTEATKQVPAQSQPKATAKPKAKSKPAPVDPVRLIYKTSEKDLLWSAYGQPKELAYEALEALQKAPEHGLDTNRYAVDTLYTLLQSADTDKALRTLDRALTAAIWSYNEDLRMGDAHETFRKRSSGKVAKKEPAAVDKDAVAALVAAINSGELRTHLDSLPPRFEAYKNLQSVLDQYTDFHLLGGWEPLPKTMSLKPGAEHPNLSALRYRLIMTDGLHEQDAGSNVYDSHVQEAIVRFQTRHGLAADGEIGPATLKALNISAADKVRRIGLNMARLRQLPQDLPKDHIAVNIPEFRLRMYRDKKESLTMGVVVGTKRTPTPAMRDKVRHLVFNPYWYPPRGITVREILPRLRRDPDYLERTGFELLRGKKLVDATKINWSEIPSRNFPYRLRQTPGEKNSLGEVKFVFPNKQAIYLHDTPSRKLFGERVRAFSHGCVRVERPRALASALMNWDRGWSDQEVDADITAAKRKLRKFKERIAIYLVYQTATLEKNTVNFHPDIYGHDVAAKPGNRRAPLVAAVIGNTPKRTTPEGSKPPKNEQLAAR